MKTSEPRQFVEFNNCGIGRGNKSEIRKAMEEIPVGQCIDVCGDSIQETEDLKKKAMRANVNMSPKGIRFSIRWENSEKTLFTIVRTT